MSYHMLGWCYALADVIVSLLRKMLYHMDRCYFPCFIIWQMLLPFFNAVLVGRTLQYMFSLTMAGVIAKWQDGTATFLCFKDGRYYCLVARWNNHIYIFWFIYLYFLMHLFVYIKLQDKHFLQTWGSHVWKLAKACLYKEIIYSVLENNLIKCIIAVLFYF